MNLDVETNFSKSNSQDDRVIYQKGGIFKKSGMNKVAIITDMSENMNLEELYKDQ